MPETPTALLALWNDVDPVVESAYKLWHATEHVPERCTVPGILWGRRYARVKGDEAMPRYLTLYGLRDAAVLDSEPYRRLLREPTPASREMRPALRNVSRWVCRLRAIQGAGQASHLAVSASDQRPTADRSGDHLLAERIVDATALPWLSSGQGGGVEGHWLLCAECDATGEVALQAGNATLFARLPVDGAGGSS